MHLFSRTTEKKERISGDAGFTIFELVVVMAIFAIMASVILFNFRSFSSKVDLDNLAQDIGLRIVEAQKSAISGQINIANTSYTPTFGVYFTNDPTNNNDTRFVYFTDLGSPGDKLFNPTPSSYDDFTCPSTPTAGNECLSVTSITTGDYIDEICYDPAVGGAFTCFYPFPGQSGQVHITFTRPFPDATITVRTGTSGAPILAKDVHIQLSSGLDPTKNKTIAVTNLGKVWVYDGFPSQTAQ